MVEFLEQNYGSSAFILRGWYLFCLKKYIYIYNVILLQRKSQRYYPTRLAINLASGMSQTSQEAHNRGCMVIETNYRIYAYTG